jgi:hypothetical protein
MFRHPMLALYGVFRGGGGSWGRFVSDRPWIYLTILGIAILVYVVRKYQRK